MLRKRQGPGDQDKSEQVFFFVPILGKNCYAQRVLERADFGVNPESVDRFDNLSVTGKRENKMQ